MVNINAKYNCINEIQQIWILMFEFKYSVTSWRIDIHSMWWRQNYNNFGVQEGGN